jgi:hypothetical protein
MEVVNQITTFINNGLEYVNDNKILSSVLGLFLVLYAALAAPKLPKSVTAWFDNVWFKLGFMFLIAYMATKDPSVAIISAVALLVTLQTLSAQKTADAVVNSVAIKVEEIKEKFTQDAEEKDAMIEARVEAIKEAHQEAIKEVQHEAEKIVKSSLSTANIPVYAYDAQEIESEYENAASFEQMPEYNQMAEYNQMPEYNQTPEYNQMVELPSEPYQEMNQEMNQEMTQVNGAEENGYEIYFEQMADVEGESNDQEDESTEQVQAEMNKQVQAESTASKNNNSYGNLCTGSTADELAGFDGHELAGSNF